ncbi:MAG: hypothetical protein GTN69_01885 [Armatimonadetes bacterium]|nr:hypothetical protein [Armatimonadota bacterium]
MTRVLPNSNDYTARDFDGLKDRIENLTRSVNPEWEDWEIANFGVMIAEQTCYIGDTVDIYRGNLSREAFLLTATRIDNVRRHTKRLGYTMAGPTAAQVDLQFTLSAPAAGDVTFLVGDIVRSDSATEPARVQLLSDLTILAGNLTGTVTAENSLTHTDYFDSDESPDQEYELPQSPFLFVVSVTDSQGLFTQVESFLDSTSTDSHYIVVTSSDDRAIIRFGDNRNGRVPAEGEITVVYKTWGGQINIEAGSLTVPEFSKQDSLDNTVYFSVTNPAAASPGSAGETIEEAKLQAPASIAAGNRSVNQADFETNALRVSGIARALMLTSDQDAGLRENYGQLRLVARGTQLASGYYAPTTPTAAQIAAVEALIRTDYPPTLTFEFEALAADFLTISFSHRLWLAEGANAATVDAAIRAAYGDFFAALDNNGVATDTVTFGANYVDEVGDPDPFIAWSDMFGIVQTTAGVRKVDEDSFKMTVGTQDYFDDVPVATTEFPKLGTITLINARTGNPLV